MDLAADDDGTMTNKREKERERDGEAPQTNKNNVCALGARSLKGFFVFVILCRVRLCGSPS